MKKRRIKCVSHDELGLTLVELMVTVIVLAIILLFAFPSFQKLVERERISVDAYNILNFMQAAQEIAISSGQIIAIVPETKIVSESTANLIGGQKGRKETLAEPWISSPWVMLFVGGDLHAQHVQNKTSDPTAIINALHDKAKLGADASEVIVQQQVINYPKTDYPSPVMIRPYGHFAKEEWEEAFGFTSLSPMLFYPDGVVNAPLFYLRANSAGKESNFTAKEPYYYIVGTCSPKKYKDDAGYKIEEYSNYIVSLRHLSGGVSNETNLLKDYPCEAAP